MERLFYECFHGNKEGLSAPPVVVSKVNEDPRVLFGESLRYFAGWVIERLDGLKWCARSRFTAHETSVDLVVVGRGSAETRKVCSAARLAIITYVRFLYSKYSNLEQPKPMRVYIALTGMKKVLPRGQGQPLSPLHVNTGFTVFDPSTPHNTIVVFRKEEVFKVLIHELTHYYNIDGAPIPDYISSGINSMFGLLNDPKLQEALTDFLACYMNVLYSSIYKEDGSFTSFKEFKDMARATLEQERKYIIGQAQKIITHLSLCSSPGRKHEATHVISYYVVKAAMYFKFASYIKDYDDHRTKSYFLKHILKDTRQLLRELCTGTTPSTSRTLCMSSVNVLEKMKTI